MLNLGPQCVQFTNGYRYRRSVGSNSSRRQSSQVPTSAGTELVPTAADWLGRMTNRVSFRVCSSQVESESSWTSGGGRAVNSVSNAANCPVGPWTSMNTPAVSLPTKPVSPSCVANRYTNGRKPTPCTTPRTVSRRREEATPSRIVMPVGLTRSSSYK